MLARLDWIKAQPQAWCHWDALRGGVDAHALIRAKYPAATCFVHESAPAAPARARQQLDARWWQVRRWTAPALQVQTPPDGAVQMLWSNMALHASADPTALVQRWHRALQVKGFLMFSCLGPDTVRELRALYDALGWGPCGHDFTDMHDWGDMLLQAGFAEPVMDMERVVLTYATPGQMLAELRGLGRNWHPARFGGLRTRRWRTRLEEAMNQHMRQDGRLALTFEIVYGHALKGEPRLAVSAESQISLEQMRSTLRRSKP